MDKSRRPALGVVGMILGAIGIVLCVALLIRRMGSQQSPVGMELTPDHEAELNALADNEEVTKAVSEEVEIEDDPEVEVVNEAS